MASACRCGHAGRNVRQSAGGVARSSISHPFASLVVSFRFLEKTTGLNPTDPWFARLRNAYLEPWGRDLVSCFDLAIRVGTFAHALGWSRQRDHLPESARSDFDQSFATLLRRTLALFA